MKKNNFLFLFFIISFAAHSQSWQQQLGTYIKHGGLNPQKIFIPPADTSSSKTGLALLNGELYKGNGVKWSQTGQVYYADNGLVLDNTTFKIDSLITVSWERLYKVVDSLAATASKDTFSVNPTITGTTFGKYPDNSTPNWVGMTAREAIVDAITNCIHPTYYSPTTGLQVSSSAGYSWAGGSGSVSYEIGTNMGDITLSEYSYIPNDAGIKDSIWGYANGNKVSMPYTVGSLNTAQSFYVKLYYAEGLCKTDNCGNTDCYGKILAGNVNSPTLTLQPYYLKFFGAAAALPNTSSQVRALPNQSYNTGATTITLNSGTTYTDFIVALPQGKTITGVIDETALNANITSSYVLTGTISVNDAGGTARTYNLYQMTIGSPYAINHVHKITHN